MTYRPLPLSAAFVAGIVFLTGSSFAQTPAKPSGAQAQPQTQESPYQGTVVEEIVARINDQVISKSDYGRAEQELDAQGRQQGWSQQQLFEQKHNLLRDLIDQQLLLSKGKELGISGEAETVKRLDDIRKQNHLDSMEDLQKAAEAQGVSYEDFRQHIREGIITSMVIRDEVGRHLSLSQSDVQKYYDEHKADFDSSEQVRLSEIMILTANPDDAAQVDAAQKKADDVAAKLKSGADFAEVAKTESGGQTAAQGGDLGQFKRGQLAKVLEDQTFDLKPGQYTQPIRTKQGFVILKVTEHTAGGVQSLKDVQPQVEDALYSEKMGPELRKYLTRLRVDGYVEVKNGYEDSGASPNEVRPVYSAYVPPTGKKKKHVERTRFRQKSVKPKPQTQTASAPAAPANVPSLAEAPGANAAQSENGASTAAAGTAGTQAAATAQTASSTPAQANSKAAQTASATGVEKPGKKEKIRFGQAPRETLPYAPTKTEDAGAAPDNGNTQVASNGNVPQNMQVVGPDGTVSGQQVEEKKEKTRFSERAKLPKQKKPKDKSDPFAPAAETTDELATRQVQQGALGLNGDTSKPPKPKPTEKIRLSDKAKEKPADQQQQQNAPAQQTAPAQPTQPAAPGSTNPPSQQ
ncbi:MAG TPA: peptidylprolyl isomerase [Pseudacidobacterium sp.]|jgi:peptidyl-prolyl cis-trans isomerase SurA|nr:peptidylprolyl isomerase [Pseudacidobacterium sp.]